MFSWRKFGANFCWDGVIWVLILQLWDMGGGGTGGD